MLEIEPEQKRRPVNLTIDEGILSKAKSLNLNTSRAAEAGILKAIKQAQAEEWKREQIPAIQAYNESVEEAGVLLVPEWDNT